MADRFPSLEDFDSGGELYTHCVLFSYTLRFADLADIGLHPAQTNVQDPSADPSADDFLAREKAILGDDADKFATVEDGDAFDAGDDDLLGGGGGETAQFEQQFPDLSGPNEVRPPLPPFSTAPRTRNLTTSCDTLGSSPRRQHHFDWPVSELQLGVRGLR